MNSKNVDGEREKFSASLQSSPATPYPDYKCYINVLNTSNKSSNGKLKSDNLLTSHALKCPLFLNSRWRIYHYHIKLLVAENWNFSKQIADLKRNIFPFVDIQYFIINFNIVPPKSTKKINIDNSKHSDSNRFWCIRRKL